MGWLASLWSCKSDLCSFQSLIFLFCVSGEQAGNVSLGLFASVRRTQQHFQKVTQDLGALSAAVSVLNIMNKGSRSVIVADHSLYRACLSGEGQEKGCTGTLLLLDVVLYVFP